MRFGIALVAAAILMFATTAIALAYVTENVSGLVANDASWTHYMPQRSATDPAYGVQLATQSWSGTDQYYYLRKCNNDQPIGAGSDSSPIRARVNDTSWKQLGPLTLGLCFRMNAKKDWSWPVGNSWWTGTLIY